MIRAEFKIPVVNPKIVYESIRMEEMHSQRSKVNLEANEELRIDIQSEDLVMLRASVNTWLRLIKVADDMIALTKSSLRTSA